MAFKPLNTTEEKAIISAIQKAETQTSGEIRVHVEKICKSVNPLDRAVEVFFHLGMDKTLNRTGILIYVSIQDRKLAIIGDKGINEKLNPDFWESVKNSMAYFFKKGELANGILEGIRLTESQLGKFFPWKENDSDELSNEISIG